MHGSHCTDDDGTLVCGWPEYHGQVALDPMAEPPIDREVDRWVES